MATCLVIGGAPVMKYQQFSALIGTGDPKKLGMTLHSQFGSLLKLGEEYDSIDIIIGNQHYFDFTVCLLKFLQILGALMVPLICHFSAGL
jgi:hypothetical protein